MRGYMGVLSMSEAAEKKRRKTDPVDGVEGRLVMLTMKKDYGRERFYPHNALALLLVDFAGCTCFTKEQLEILKKLGYELKLHVEGLEGIIG